jgi:hypothetical protein
LTGQRGSRRLAGVGCGNREGRRAHEPVFHGRYRIRDQTCGARGVCESALKLRCGREGSLRNCGQGRQPDSGNPTVRDEIGGSEKRGLWWNCEPTSQPKGRGWKPSTCGCARFESIQTALASPGKIPVLRRAGYLSPTHGTYADTRVVGLLAQNKRPHPGRSRQGELEAWPMEAGSRRAA